MPKTVQGEMLRATQAPSPWLLPSLDPFATGALTTGDYYSAASGMIFHSSNYHMAPSTTAKNNPPVFSSGDNLPGTLASSTQRLLNTKRSLDIATVARNLSVRPLREYSNTPWRKRSQPLCPKDSNRN